MNFDPTLAAIRFGTGLSPRLDAPRDVAQMLADLQGPDRMDQRHPIPGFDLTSPSLAELQRTTRDFRQAGGTDGEEAALARMRATRRSANAAQMQQHLTIMARALDSQTGLRERLAAFWADHFTVKSRSAIQTHLIAPYIEDAIRPHVAGSFRQMLRAVVEHPMMLLYLQQWRSTGPGSRLGQRMGRGLNENLARELLELHTLGVGGTYTQTDVRELAELLTGLTYHARRGFFFDDRLSEPGAEEVLGVTFSEDASLDTIRAALEMLALHLQTARHLAEKMAIHFVSPTPDPALVARMAQAYQDTEGNLFAMTAAMLQSDAAWTPAKTKVRLPGEYITASLRALGVTGDDLLATPRRRYRNLIARPLQVMGQPWQKPIGPDGWSEEASDWIIPQAMAGRISWAMQAPNRILRKLPDPRDFVETALADHATPEVRFAAGAAETPREGIGIVLASAAFQRR